MKWVLPAALLVLSVFASPAFGHAAGRNLELLSPDPVAGDYTMVLRIDDFTLTTQKLPPGTPGDDDTGYIAYFLDGVPCVGQCSGGMPFESANATFTFYDVKAGDSLLAAAFWQNGTLVDPPLEVTATVRNVNVPTDGPRLEIVGTAPQPGTPNPGTYTMMVNAVNVDLKRPGSVTANDREEGHLRYMLNGAVCADACSDGANPETDQTTFTFHDLKKGDQVGVELLQNDGSPFSPAVRALQVVAVASLQIQSAQPHAPTATMTVKVTSFTLVAPTNPPSSNNAGAGHIHYLVKHHGKTDFEPAKGDYATASTTFTFTDLAEDDVVAAELVNNDHSVLASPVIQSQTVLPAPEKDPLAPSVGPIVAVVLLAVALVVRNRRGL